jgi:DNA-binding CsgD family transcriptional regulator
MVVMRGIDSVSHELVGRDDELAVVDRVLSALAQGRGGVLWLGGVPGIGKSALVDVLVRRARESGAAVLQGIGDELAQVLPLRLMADCLGVSGWSEDPARVQIAALLRGEGDSAQAIDPVLAAAERMLELVDRLCAHGPLVLVCDDLQWADEPSARLWRRLARSTVQAPLLLVGASRPVATDSVVDGLPALAAELDGAVVDLGPLAESAAIELAGRAVGGEVGPLLRAELARAGGNALYLGELVEALVGDGLVRRSGPVAEYVGEVGGTPDSVMTAITHRLGFLSDRARRTAQVAALIGSDFDVAVLGPAVGMQAGELADAVRELIDAGVVQAAREPAGSVLDGSTGEHYVFRHSLIQEALADQIPGAVRDLMNGHLAWLLAQSGSAVAVVASRLLELPGEFGSWVSQWLSELDPLALFAAPEISARLLERAVGSSAGDGALRAKVVARLVRMLYFLGRDARVIELVSARGDQIGLDEDELYMQLCAVRSAGRSGRCDEALAVSARLLELPGLPLPWRSKVESWSVIVHLSLGDLEAAGQAAERALADARAAGDSLSIGYALHAASMMAPAEEAVRHVEAALEVLGDDGEATDLRILMMCNRLLWLAQQGRLDEFEAELPGALILAERAGSPRYRYLQSAAAEVCFIAGEWDEALVHLAGRDPDAVDSQGFAHLYGLSALIALHRADRAGAEPYLAAIEAALAPQAAQRGLRVNYMYAALTLRAEVDGDLAGAFDLAGTWLATPPGLGRSQRNDEAPDVVRLALANGDRDSARLATEIMEAQVQNEPTPDRVAPTRLCRALLDDDVEGLLSTAEFLRAMPWPLLAGTALEEAAVRLAATGPAARARAALTEAVECYAEVGAQWDVRRADARLRALGVRRGSHSAHRQERSGWGALTPAELRIAGMVGAGRSNSDIAAELLLSRHTVQAHVSNILGKLGLRSRSEVAREVAAHEAGSGDRPAAAPVAASPARTSAGGQP